ncbi:MULTISPECIES: hypothetical protein [unclassified Streptomyces]|uniref:hypothetical protein n=1 Tax=unclassified Streptomyces TaxID=2593676 RepID=UPI003685A3E9
MSDALASALTSSPLLSLFQVRWGSRVDRALVFLREDGEACLEHPRRGQAPVYPSPRFAAVGRRMFDSAWWVSLVERKAVVHLAAPGSAHREPDRVMVTWWVCDPVIVARERLSAPDAAAWVAHDISRRGMHPVVNRGEYGVPEAGISYRIGRSVPPPEPRPSPGADIPPAWGEDRRITYRFYREALAEGPLSLAALWLLHYPEQARDVLDWTMANRGALDQHAEWEHSLVTLLQGLSAEERGFIGVKMAELLSGMGIPHADDALHRVRAAT